MFNFFSPRVSPNLLSNSLVERPFQSGNRSSAYKIAYTVPQATQSIDALAKLLYELLFEFIVDRSNYAISDRNRLSVKSQNFIGCLDIFGFEVNPLLSLFFWFFQLFGFSLIFFSDIFL